MFNVHVVTDMMNTHVRKAGGPAELVAWAFKKIGHIDAIAVCGLEK